MPKIDPDHREFIDSLHLSQQKQTELLGRLSHGASQPPTDERRIAQRLPFHEQAGLIVQVRHPGGTSVNYLVRPRNLSSTGIAFLHGAFVHMGTQCTVVLRTVDRRVVGLEGKVVRCQHVSAHVHDVGVRFSQLVRVKDFVGGLLLVDDQSKVSQALPSLKGRVLYVVDSTSDRDLLKFHLDSVGVEMEVATDAMAAVDLLGGKSVDLVIVEAWLPMMSGEQVVAALRESGYSGPIVLLTADEREETRRQAAEAGCSQVLFKPYAFGDMLTVLRQVLARDDVDDANDREAVMPSEMWSNRRMRPIITAYVNRLDGQVRQLRRLVDEGAAMALVHKLCLDIKGLAGGYGYPRIGQAAFELYKLSVDDAPAEHLLKQIDQLAGFCRAAARGVGEASEPPGTGQR